MSIVNPAKIYSTLGNPSSLIPLAIKDAASTAGMTAGSYITGKEEGQDRLIDELGTEIIWLCGIPAFKKIFDCTVFKFIGLDSKFDVRNLKNKDVFEKIKEYAPTEDIKNDIEKIAKNESKFKNAAIAKFVVSTGLTIAAYLGLTKFKQKYTEKKIRQNLIDEYNKNKNTGDNSTQSSQISNPSQPSFKGVGKVMEYFAFDPVKNMWIIDGGITTERLYDSRNSQELWGYAIKEASLLFFLYYAGEKIQELLVKNANKKHNKDISFDARVLEDENFKKAFENGEVEKSLKEFDLIKASSGAKTKKDAVSLYEFLHKNPDNLITKIAKQSDLVSIHKESKKIDTRKFIDLEKIENLNEKLKLLNEQYKSAIAKGETSEQFFKQVKKLKRNSVLTDIGACITALGIITPAIMLLKRKLGNEDTEFATKKEIRKQLEKEGVIK